MKTYGDLDLKKIREVCDLDFAHYTYGRHQCSCCYGPFDMAARYWKNRKKPVEVTDKVFESGGRAIHYELDGKRISKSDISYILFSNAYNGRGRIKSKDQPIETHTYISYHFKSEEQKRKVCQMLLDQLDSDYVIGYPLNDLQSIVIYVRDEYFRHPDNSLLKIVYFGEKI